jgi:hypothetical protein
MQEVRRRWRVWRRRRQLKAQATKKAQVMQNAQEAQALWVQAQATEGAGDQEGAGDACRRRSASAPQASNSTASRVVADDAPVAGHSRPCCGVPSVKSRFGDK